MKLRILSDLHLEFSDFFAFAMDEDVVVLAGDIAKGARGIGWARASFPNNKIVYVAGNHEFYGTNRLETLARLRITARECDVYFLDDEAVVIDGVRFLGSTLWTDFELFGPAYKPLCMKHAGEMMNDFRYIFERDRVFAPMDSVLLHQRSRMWLEASLAELFDGDTVVVTHHLPSIRSVAGRYEKNSLSAAFASNVEHLMGVPACWIHGHTHDSNDYNLNGTRVVCNPRGYALSMDNPENYDFDLVLVIEV